MDTFIGRQAVFDRHNTVVAYELLFRADSNSTDSSRQDCLASYEVIQSAFLDIGVDRLLNGRHGLVNLERETLLDRRIHILPSDIVKLEILETVAADGDVVSACRELKRRGFTLVLDDYAAQPGSSPMVDLADWVKVDFRQIPDPADRTKVVRELTARGKRVLAEKLETRKEFDEAMQAGFHLFQGVFLQHPATFTGHSASPSQLHRLRLLAMLAEPELDMFRLEPILSKDAALTYLLLRYANSSRFGGHARISSVREAMVRLGSDEVRRIVTLAVLPKISPGENRELLRNALIRARMSDQVSKLVGWGNLSEQAFLTGLFSLLDAILHVPMPEIVDELPLEDSVTNALLNPEDLNSPLAMVVQVAKTYEETSWEQLVALSSRMGLQTPELVTTYFDAVAWAHDEV